MFHPKYIPLISLFSHTSWHTPHLSHTKPPSALFPVQYTRFLSRELKFFLSVLIMFFLFSFSFHHVFRFGWTTPCWTAAYAAGIPHRMWMDAANTAATACPTVEWTPRPAERSYFLEILPSWIPKLIKLNSSSLSKTIPFWSQLI